MKRIWCYIFHKQFRRWRTLDGFGDFGHMHCTRCNESWVFIRTIRKTIRPPSRWVS